MFYSTTKSLGKSYFVGLWLLSIVLLSSCGNGKVHEGTIEFEVTYPTFKSTGFIANLLPDKMVMKFRGNVCKTEVKKGKAFSQCFISDSDKKVLTTLFQFGNERKYAVSDEKETRKLIDKDYPTPIYMDSNEGDSIVGFLCKRTVAIYEDIHHGDVTLFFTDGIGIDDPNWFLPFPQVKGVLLEYDIERYGLKMHFRAVKFDDSPVQDTEFEVPSNYRKMSAEALEKDMAEMFTTLAN